MVNDFNDKLMGTIEFCSVDELYIKYFNYVDLPNGNTTYDKYVWAKDFSEATIHHHEIILTSGEDMNGEPCFFEDDMVIGIEHNAFNAATINKLLADQCDPAYPIDWVDVGI